MHKVDQNQKEIVKALRSLPRCSVTLLSAVGHGCPDLLIGYKGVNFLIELKVDNNSLTPRQKIWHDTWFGRVYECRTLDEILIILKEGTKTLLGTHFNNQK